MVHPQHRETRPNRVAGLDGDQARDLAGGVRGQDVCQFRNNYYLTFNLIISSVVQVLGHAIMQKGSALIQALCSPNSLTSSLMSLNY